MIRAKHIIRRHNRHALTAEEGDYLVAIEEVSDTDGRMYKLEYRSTPDGRRAVAFCLYNPWGGLGNPSAGEDYLRGHVAEDGFICVGDGSDRRLEASPFDLDFTIRRARFWCTAFSYLKEHGSFPNP